MKNKSEINLRMDLQLLILADFYLFHCVFKFLSIHKIIENVNGLILIL